MQNKLYTIQFSHHPMTDSQSVPKQRWRNPERADLANFAELLKETELLEKSELSGKRGFELTEKRRKK